MNFAFDVKCVFHKNGYLFFSGGDILADLRSSFLLLFGVVLWGWCLFQSIFMWLVSFRFCLFYLFVVCFCYSYWYSLVNYWLVWLRSKDIPINIYERVKVMVISEDHMIKLGVRISLISLHLHGGLPTWLDELSLKMPPHIYLCILFSVMLLQKTSSQYYIINSSIFLQKIY